MNNSMGCSGVIPVVLVSRSRDCVAESRRSAANASSSVYQCRISRPLLRLFQACFLSNQVVVFRSEVATLPDLSFAYQRYHTFAPGGSLPDFRISQVQRTRVRL